MISYINELKTKPIHIRKRFAFIVAFSFTFIVFAGWIASYGIKSSSTLAESDKKVDAPVSSLRATAIGAYDDIKDLIFGSNKSEYNADSIEVKGGKR